MRFRSFLVSFFLFLFIGLQAAATPAIRFRAKLTEKGLVVRCGIPAGYYTYKSSPYATPLSITATAGSGVSFGTGAMPAGVSKGEETLYYGMVKVTLPLTSRGSVSSGSRFTVTLRVKYQLCESAAGVCHQPREKRVTVRVTMPAGGSAGTDPGQGPVPPGTDDGNIDPADSRDFSGYRGSSSGPAIKMNAKAVRFGAGVVTHSLRNVSVNNRLRLIMKANPGVNIIVSVYYWKDRKWHYVYAPRKFSETLKNGKTRVELFFPEAGEYRVSFRGYKKGMSSGYLFYYKVTARAAFPEAGIPARPISRFHKDGFRLVTHKKAFLTARNKMTIVIKGHPKSWMYAYLRDAKYKTYYSPWQTKDVGKDGTYRFNLLFPKTGEYRLSVSGRPRSKDKKSHHYLTYKIRCVAAYPANRFPVPVTAAFSQKGFTRSGLSHPYYKVNAGRSVKLVFRGNPGLKMKAYFSRSKPWKYFRYAPRVFVMPDGGKYTVYAWFPEAATYNLGVKVETTKKGDRYRKYSKIADYKITASGGYGDRALDIKMGYYTGEEKYSGKKTGKKKVAYGSAGELMWVTDMRQAERISRSQNRILMILHSASWCGYCKKLKKETFRHPDVVRYAKNRIVAIVVGDKPIRNMSLYNSKYKKYRGGIPSVTFISPQGKRLLTRTGYSAGRYYVKVLKNVVAMQHGLVERYIRYHKQGYSSYSHKLIKLYQSLGKKYKAAKIMKDLITAGKISSSDLPKYYLQIAKASYGSTAEKYYRKIINGYSYRIGYYWYQAVYKMAIQLYGGGYGGYTAEKLNANERRSIAFIRKYASRSYYSPLWLSWYKSLIPGIKAHADRKRKKKGWTVSPKKKDGLDDWTAPDDRSE